MTKLHKGLILIVVVSAGLWGCSQNEHKTSVNHDKRLKALEEKCGDLEASCQTLQKAHDEAKEMLTKVEKEKEELQQQLELAKLVAKERDDLKQIVDSRTHERDGYHVQLQELRKGIRTLLTRVESALPPNEDAVQKISIGPKL